MVTLSTASTYPESTAAAFEMAARLGYDGLEVMVLTDAVSQDPTALLRLRDHYGIAITSVHAPCLLISQRVWGTEPWPKLRRAQAAAELLGASTVVVHRRSAGSDYAREFVTGIERWRADRHPVAVENVLPGACVAGVRGLPAGKRPRRRPPHTTPVAHLGVAPTRSRWRATGDRRPVPRRQLGSSLDGTVAQTGQQRAPVLVLAERLKRSWNLDPQGLDCRRERDLRHALAFARHLAGRR
jgi:hypothetical protein